MDPMKQANETMDNQAADREQQVAGMVPPPEEPLDPGAVNVLSQTVERVAGVLTGGQVGGEPLQVEGPQAELPPQLAAKVMTLGEFARAGGFEAYTIEPSMLTTSAGLEQVSVLLDGMAQDENVIRATKQGPGKQAGRRVSPNGSKTEEPPKGPTADEAAEQLAGRRVSPNGSKTT